MIIREIWGTISPTKPIIPEKATITPVINAPTTKMLKRNRITGIPSVAAVSSPTVKAFSAAL